MILFNSYNNYDIKLLSILYATSIILGVFIIISKNPIFSVLFLIGLFFVTALYLISIGLTFIGLSYLLVYVGAISILFLFILMLINIRISELITEGKNSVPLAILTIISITYILGNILPYNVYSLEIGIHSTPINYMESDFVSLFTNGDVINSKSNIELITGTKVDMFKDVDNSILSTISTNIAELKNYNWELSLIPVNHVISLGKIFYGDLYINIILISLVLLLAMIGAIIITVKKDNFDTLNMRYKDDIIIKV